MTGVQTCALPIWYAPFFSAYSFALARAEELEADRLAASLVGTHAMKDALAAHQVIARLMDELYWPALNRRTITNPTPPASHFDELITILQRETPQDLVQKWMHEAMQQTTGYADTHPALADRLAALDQVPDKPNAPEPPAGDRKSTRLNSSHMSESRMPSSA